MMQLIDYALEVLVVVAGSAAVGYAGWNAFRFSKIPKRLSRAFSLNLLGMAFAGAFTLLLGLSQTFSLLRDFSDIQQNIVRVLMLLFLLVPSRHLRRIVWEIEHGGGEP